MGDVWALRIAGIIAVSLTICFVALAMLTDPAHGPFMEVVVVGAAVSIALLFASHRLGKRRGL